jgi:hypothetical protein
MNNFQLVFKSALSFTEKHGIDAPIKDKYLLLKFATLEIVPHSYSKSLFDAIESAELNELELHNLVELISIQTEIYARQMTPQCVKTCLDFVEKYYKTNGLNELVCNCDDALSAHYQAYNKSRTSEPIDLLV